VRTSDHREQYGGVFADLAKTVERYVVPPRDAEKLSVAINSLVRQPELKQRMSTHSSERIRIYSPGACADGLAAAAISLIRGSMNSVKPLQWAGIVLGLGLVLY